MKLVDLKTSLRKVLLYLRRIYSIRNTLTNENCNNNNNNNNSVALSAGEVCRPKDPRLSAKLMPTFADRGASRGQRGGSLRPQSRFSRPEPLLFLSSSSSIVLTRLNGPRSTPTTSKKNW
jgi:hypothetical protein